MFVFVKEMLVNVIRKSHVLRFLARKAKASSHGDICGFSERYRVLKVWHIYARTYNFGDHALGIGVRDLFRKAFRKHGVELIFEVVDTHRFYASSDDVQMWNNEGDLILVGGGGLLHCWDGLHWMCHLPSGLVSKLKIPLCVFGIGYNQMPSQGRLPWCVRRNVGNIMRRSVGFSVRNDGSKEKMRGEGFQVDQVPDPGFFLDGDYPPTVLGRYVVVQTAGDGVADRMSDVTMWIREYAKCADWLMQQGVHIVFVPHCEQDIDITKGVISLLSVNNYEVADFWDGVLDEHCHEILSLYKHAEMVIGSRGHAQIISFGMGTPFVTFSTHYKQRALSEKFGLHDYVTSEPKDFMNCLRRAYSDRDKIIMIEREGMARMTHEMESYLDQLVISILDRLSKWKRSWWMYKCEQISDFARYIFG